nr:MAG TPA: hypothetical protein [Caudoviricetes sp.]
MIRLSGVDVNTAKVLLPKLDIEITKKATREIDP